MFPDRFSNRIEAHKKFGDRAERYGSFLTKMDPLADAVVEKLADLPKQKSTAMIDQALNDGIKSVSKAPKALKTLFEQVDDVPIWVDWEELKLGGETFLKTGPFGSIILICYSLPLAYVSPGGNKPLAITGQLRERAYRRLNETGRFVLETSKPDGLRRNSDGFKMSIKVRLMHAEVRRLLLESDKWDEKKWGMPINQADMVGTNLLFSYVALDGLKKIGMKISTEESEALIKLWRYNGYLLGIDPELHCSTVQESAKLWDLICMTQGEPDQDSRDLVDALMHFPEHRYRDTPHAERAKKLVDFYYGMSRTLIGEERANQLRYPKTLWRFSAHLLKPILQQTETLRRRLSASDKFATSYGTKLWEQAVEQGLEGIPAEFNLPQNIYQLFKSKKED